MKYDFLIVGAGLFGSVFARQMTDKGKRCLVVDRRPFVGGNCFTEKCGEITVHKYGAHIFHTSDEDVWQYVNRYAQFEPFINSPLANFKGEMYNLPFNMNTFHALWGVVTPAEVQEKLNQQRIAFENPQNLEQQALSLVGKDIYEKLVKGYTEKQWGRNAAELPAFILKRLPLRFTYDNNYFNDVYQGIPKEGYTALVQTLLEGIDVQTGVSYNGISKDNLAEQVVYTGAIDEFFGYCFGALEYRSLRFETQRLDIDDFQHNAVVNYTDKDVPFTRIIEHKHFLKTQCGYTVITKEYPCNWSKGQEPYYPINDDRNNALYEKYRQLASQKNVIFGGRLGLYKYFDMDKTVRSALDLSDKFC